MEFASSDIDIAQPQHDIGNIISARAGIESDKITERKKSAISLKELLHLPHILDHIDGASGRGGEGLSRSKGKGRGNGGAPITWVALFKSILTYIEKEIDSITKLEDKGASSATAVSNRQMRKKDVADMIRVYVRAANKRCNLPIVEVMAHMMNVLDNKHLGVWLGMDYTQILLNYVLAVPEYVIQISAQKWDELISLYCHVYLSSQPPINKALVTKIIYTLISQVALQSDLPMYKLYCFFTKAFSNLTSEEKNTKVLEHLLAAFNTFSSSAAVYNARGRLSTLGEEVLPTILSLWTKVTYLVREQMITFLRMQLSIHHPHGRHTDDMGAWSHNDRVFKKNLEKLYDVLISDFESPASRLRWTGKSEGSQSFEILDLSVDVIHQVMYIRDRRELSSLDPTVHRGKRHKVQTCWDTLRDGLGAGTDKASLISWLQLISWLLSKWPESLPTDDYLPLLTHLCKILRETKRGDCVKWLLVCLSALAMNPVSHVLTTPPHHSSTHTNELWKKVWLSTMKILSVHTAEFEGYNLLTQLLEQGLVKCDMEPWKLLNTTFNLPTRPVVSFIASILQNHTLPDRPLPYMTTPLATPTIIATQSSAANDHTTCYSSYPLRTQLLQFLVPQSLAVVGDGGVDTDDLDAMRRVPHSTVKMANSTSPALLAHLLVSLTQRSYSSAKLSLLKSLYMPSSCSSYVRGLLETQSRDEPPSLDSPDLGGRDFEQVYLESTFDVPLDVPCLNTVTKEPLLLSRENTISVLQSLLLDLLTKRSELLLQPTDFQTTSSPREHCQHLSILLETQAHHCSLVLHSLLLLCHCEASSRVKITQLVRTILTILQEIVTALKVSFWNEVERPFYYQTVKAVLNRVQPQINFYHLDSHSPSPLLAKVVWTARSMFVQSLPKELMEMVQMLAHGKFPVLPSPSLASNSAFSLCESSRSSSRRPSETASSDSPVFNDSLELSESTTSTTMGDSNGSNVTSPGDFLSVCSLSPKSVCQLESAKFVCYCYKNYVAVGDMSDNIADGFDYKSALLSMLTEGRDFKKAVHVQIIFESVDVLTSGLDVAEPAVLNALVDVFGSILRIHRKNQCVYSVSISKLHCLVRHLCRSKSGNEVVDEAREKCQVLVSAFWGLYLERSLPPRVRLKLAHLLQTLLMEGRSSSWTNIIVKKKKKKGDTSSEIEKLSTREVLIQMVNDSDHCVRMHMAKVVSSLYLDVRRMVSCDTHMTLLPREEQSNIFEKVAEMLKKADMVENNQDELSTEDDSVNRVSSLIATLQHEACVSPVCERKVVSLLIAAVGQRQIDLDVTVKALNQMACYLGYEGTKQFLEGMLITIVSCWLDAGLQLSDFPVKLMGYGSAKDFLSTYSSQIIPFLVSKCDESTLESLSNHTLATALPTLLKDSLPSSMVLILTNYAQQDRLDSEEGSQERRKKASESHNLLLKHLTEEVVAQTIKMSIDDFVVQLLVRMSEPHNSHTHLAKYTLSSDPEPCAPHFPSLAVRATLDYMPSCYGSTGSRTSFVKLLSHRKDNIQRILLSLSMKIQTSHRSFEKRRYLLAYHIFVKLVCREFESDLEKTRSFIIMDIIHTIVRVLSPGEEGKASTVRGLSPRAGGRASTERQLSPSDGGRASTERQLSPREGGKASTVRELFSLSCDTLELVCKATLESCPEELTKHLHSLVAVLTPFTQETNTIIGEQALSLLTYILDTVDPDHVARLDPFPEEEPFIALATKQTSLRQEVGGTSLADEIDRFLSVGRKCPHSVRSKALFFLQRQLHSSKLELVSLVKQGSTSPVLQLIQGLVSQCQSSSASSDYDVSRCLGEIGPADLGCIAIPVNHDGHAPSTLPESPTARILHHLGTLLLDNDISVVQASGECLRCILTTKTGQLVLKKLEDLDHDVNEWCLYLEPFKQQRKKKSARSTITPPTLPSPSTFLTLIDPCDLWIPSEGVSHGKWITRLVTTLIGSGAVTDEVLLLMEPVCRVKVEFCEEVFPLLIYNILSANKEDYRSVISNQIKLFFSTVSTTPSSRPSTPSPSTQAHTSRAGPLNPDSVQTMLNMVMYLRTVDRPKQSRGSTAVSTPWENNFWLDLDFLDVAMAAQLSSSYFTSLLYIEIWHGAKSTLSPTRRRSGSSSSGVDLMDIEVSQIGPGLKSGIDDPKVQKLLLEAYSRIGEPDSLYGACSTHATDETTRVRLYEHEGQWHKSLSSYSLQMQLPGTSCESNIAESLHQLGLTPILNLYMCGVESVWGGGVSGGEVGEYQYESAWRMTTWDDRPEGYTPLHLTNGNGGYHQCVFNCITALRDGEPSLLENSLSEARSHVIHSLCSTGLESTYSLYPSLSKLLSLLELEEASLSTLTSQSQSLQDLNFLKDWTDRLPYLDCDFKFVEPILALRYSTLHCMLQTANKEVKGHSDEGMRRRVEDLFQAVRDILLTQAQLAREAGIYQVSEGALFSLKQLQTHQGNYNIPESLCPSLSWRIQLEEAKLQWERGEGPLAMALLKALLQRFGQHSHLPPDAASLYPLALSLYGSWLADTQSESPSIIMSKYLEKSVSLMAELQHSSDQPEVVKAYLTLARYSDTQYQRIKRHMESLTFQNKKQLIQRSKQELEKIQTMSVDARQIARHVRVLQTQSEEDEIAVDNLLEEKQHFLEKALQNYILCLKAGDEHDLRVFRLSALWFANSSHGKVNQIITNGVGSLQTRKFLPLMYQLAARMSARTLKSEPFQQALQDIIFRTTLDHPHHCLYSILALSNASKDDKFPSSGHVSGNRCTGRGSGRLSRKGTSGGSVDEDKVKAACGLITKLRKQKPSLVQSAEQLCDAYMDLAYHDVTAHRKERGPFKLPSSCPLVKLRKMSAAVPTIDIDVDPMCCYDDIVSVDKFDPYFELAGGVNLPKVISCVGSDGKRRRQLVKGKDDLRQDAVMQQVFVLVNRLLKKEPATNKRRLCVRTYKVIPLSQRSGIVEWCEETCPLGEYLIGSPRSPHQGAHHRYQPHDWTSIECRKKLMAACSDRKLSKFDVFSDICKHFQPVFHHFFMEKFPSPPQWFEKRLTYTRSVAASSIVGYLLGLGDRHVQNILIDKNTAEFIHIDLGVAFEQGKTLPTPETVPFRLTRDLVDGMGIAGVEGVFRRCCEKTTVLMRAHQEELRTIVEVLLHDPLYQWTLSPLKALNLQRAEHFDDISATPSTSSGVDFNGGQSTTANGAASNKMAERVLLRLQEKLGGIEDGVPLSVSGQVNKLIQEATDHGNLCVLFPGWQPWV